MGEKQERKRTSKFYDKIPCCQIRKQITENLKISYKDAAAMLQKAGVKGTSPEAVRQWCGGYTRPDVEKLLPIANALGCSISFLMGADDYPDPEIAKICKATGLSGSAIEALQQCREDEKELLSGLLSDNLFRSFLSFVESAIEVECASLGSQQLAPGHARNAMFPSDRPGYYNIEGSVAARVCWDIAAERLRNIGKDIARRSLSKETEVTDHGND